MAKNNKSKSKPKANRTGMEPTPLIAVGRTNASPKPSLSSVEGAVSVSVGSLLPLVILILSPA
jgi:hypothetical protein